ncbi:MFS-type transporter involved in bile tolerance, Atg22 family [Micromonospora pallida]|uniref:Multidrug efflux pump Tap n=1 Tax=Micromonospora pallida TaxID=145854 RepID=A0A1C6RMB3_9ACTN|nr:MFS transporter [Micromonospora pallida]SCL18301.1 MFS-type transporter involved in bile tolerance, Atg22 family [Micromonospora pallida]
MSAAPRRRGPLAGLLIGHVISLTGNMLTIIALPLYVLAETGSAAATGITGAVATAPIVLGGALGGVVVDRIGYRRASIMADLVSGVTIGAVPLLDATVGLPFWALLVLVFASGLLDTPGQTARNALLPEAATAAGVPLERAIGWYEATERAARLIGAPVAGLLVAALGSLTVLAIDAATFAVSAAVVAALVSASLRPAERTADDGGNYWHDFAAGVRFLLTEPLLRALVLLVLVTNFFDATKSNVLLPVVAQRELGGAAALGLLVGTMGGGALVGSLAFSAIGHRLPRRATFVTAFAVGGAPPFWSLAAGFPLPVQAAVFAIAGLAAGAINPLIGAVKLERVPAHMRARVYGVIGAAAWAAIPLGALSAGFASDHVGTTAILVTVGVGYFLVVLTPLLGGPWRTMGRPPSDQRQQDPATVTA